MQAKSKTFKQFEPLGNPMRSVFKRNKCAGKWEYLRVNINFLYKTFRVVLNGACVWFTRYTEVSRHNLWHQLSKISGMENVSPISVTKAGVNYFKNRKNNDPAKIDLKSYSLQGF